MLRHTTPRSSNVKDFAYNAETNELHITFRHGGEYIYQDVHPDHYEMLKATDSPGSYLHEHIKDAHEFRRP